ncbi:MAG TPA: hypothetical protein ENI27_10890 [bacterium]|nr:hypothetical protein [bacterium]
MLSINTIVPLISSLLSIVFTILVVKRFADKKGSHLHLLVWAIGLMFYGIGGAAEAYYGVFGWSSLVFRLWYLCGAILVAAWLGQGTIYLLVTRRVAHILMGLLAAASIYSLIRVFTAELNPLLMTTSIHTGSKLSGHAIITSGVRILTPFFNLYGTAALVGGALWSAFVFWRKRILLHRTLGNILIAIGAILPASGGTFSRLGVPNALYLGELLGIILIFLGFIRATTPMKAGQKREAASQ